MLYLSSNIPSLIIYGSIFLEFLQIANSSMCTKTDRFIYIYWYISTGKFVYMAHHFILLRLNPFGLRVNGEGWWFEPSVSWLRLCLSAEAAVNISWLRLSPLREWGSWLWHLLVNMYIYGSLFHLATVQFLWL